MRYNAQRYCALRKELAVALSRRRRHLNGAAAQFDAAFTRLWPRLRYLSKESSRMAQEDPLAYLIGCQSIVALDKYHDTRI
jgi:hypothetical protein